MNEPKLEIVEVPTGVSQAEWNDRLRRAAKIIGCTTRELADSVNRAKHLNEGMGERWAVKSITLNGSVSWHLAPEETPHTSRILVPAEPVDRGNDD